MTTEFETNISLATDTNLKTMSLLIKTTYGRKGNSTWWSSNCKKNYRRTSTSCCDAFSPWDFSTTIFSYGHTCWFGDSLSQLQHPFICLIHNSSQCITVVLTLLKRKRLRDLCRSRSRIHTAYAVVRIRAIAITHCIVAYTLWLYAHKSNSAWPSLRGQTKSVPAMVTVTAI